MKITVISPSRAHLHDISTQLQARGHAVACHEGGKARMREVAEQERPDMMIADGMCCDPAELSQVEYVTSHHPRTAVVLMCSTQTPEFLMESMRAGVREVLPSPPPADALDAAVARVASKLRVATREPARVLAFVSCKGGAGATLLATNLAFELAQHRRVLVLDLNLHFGDALSFVYDSRPTGTLADVAANIGRLDATYLSAIAVKVTPRLSVLAAPEDPAQAMEVQPEHVDAILEVARANYDDVVIDVGRSVDTFSIRALDHATRIFAVLQPQLPYIRNAQKMLETFQALGYPTDRCELVVNRYDPRGDIALEKMQRFLNGSKLFAVPESAREVSASINHGEPLLATHRTCGAARALIQLAERLAPQRPQPHQHHLLGKLFRRA